MPNGKVLVTGGVDTSSSEIYDPESGQWTPAFNLNSMRWGHAATVLLNGKVLFTGGQAASNVILNTTELYDEGLDFKAAWQPQIANTSSPLLPATSLSLTGNQLQGIAEASGGAVNYSATSYPLVQLSSLINGQIIWLLPDPATGWSDTTFTTIPLPNFTPGYARLTVFTNGIPSLSHIVMVASCNYSVVATTDDGKGTVCGTLSFALIQAATSKVAVTITLPANITITGEMPVVTSTNNIKITLAGSCNFANGTAVPGSQLLGGGKTSSALTLTNNVTVSGVKITGFKSFALNVTGTQNQVICSWLGTSDGLTASGNGGGLHLMGSDNQFGLENDPNSRLLISGNTGPAILVEPGSKNNRLFNSWIGLNSTGIGRLVNTEGVKIKGGGQLIFGPNNRIQNHP